jgi:DeoR family fructose operon transcriptional repressor
VSVTKYERFEKILDSLRASQRATVKELADTLKTTEITIRRDLKELDKKGLVKRVYGGALVTDNDPLNFSIERKMTRNIEAKRRIGKKAAELIEDGDLIFLDPGTTCWEIVPYLATKKRLNIIINSSRLATAFRNEQNHNIIYIGGEYRPFRMDIVGDLAGATIEKLRGYKAFAGADGIDIELGLSANDITSASIARKMFQNAREITFLGDSSKFDHPSLCKIADINVLDYIITDKPVSEKWEEAAKKHNITILYAD